MGVNGNCFVNWNVSYSFLVRIATSVPEFGGMLSGDTLIVLEISICEHAHFN